MCIMTVENLLQVQWLKLVTYSPSPGMFVMSVFAYSGGSSILHF